MATEKTALSKTAPKHNRHVQESKHIILILEKEGKDALCGLCCTKNAETSTVRLKKIEYLPKCAAGYIKLEEAEEMIRDINAILNENYIAPIPTIFLHFIIPLSPAFILSHYREKRSQLLSEYFEQKNVITFAERRCHWILLAGQKELAILVSHDPSPNQPALSKYGTIPIVPIRKPMQYNQVNNSYQVLTPSASEDHRDQESKDAF